MSKEIQVFNNDQFGNIRTVLDDNGDPLFCLADVCRILGLRTSKVSQRLDDDVLSKYPIVDSIGREQNVSFVNEDGMYDAILDSRKPDARKFRKWVTSDILPSIRKHGAYMTESTIEKAITSPDFLIQLATKLKDEQQKRIAAETLVIAAKPKVAFYDAVVDSKDAIDMAQVAKVLNMGVGRNRLFAILRDNHILNHRNEPFQYYIDQAWCRCVESQYMKPNGDTCINIKTVFFQKGLDGIRRLLNKLNKSELAEYDDVQ